MNLRSVVIFVAAYWLLTEVVFKTPAPKGNLDFPPDTPPPSSPDEWANPYRYSGGGVGGDAIS